ncbi:putative dipeptidyl-aminopeptidase B [Diplocarpon rosae]|nr:putative dipeptidyl-aminopeptidase B [Diplocarpon rosae]
MAPHVEDATILPPNQEQAGRDSEDSISSTSTTSLVFERIGQLVEAVDEKGLNGNGSKMVTPKFPYRGDSIGYADDEHATSSHDEEEKDFGLETGPFLNHSTGKPADKRFRRLLWTLGGLFVGTWLLAFVLFLGNHSYQHVSSKPHNPSATSSASQGNGKKVTLNQVLSGKWRATKHGISWIEGANGEDGLLLEQSAAGKDFLIVEDIRGSDAEAGSQGTKTLMKNAYFTVGGQGNTPDKVFPSKDLKKVLIATDYQSNWRHSFYAKYWIFDVETQSAQALDPADVDGRIQLASWSPQSDAVVFTRNNNLFLRKLSSTTVTQITTDGGPNLFYGVPDWVYEEEVFGGNSATWWAEDGKYIAFLRTNESAVPEYPIQYFVSRPSGAQPKPGEENYPEVRQIKYPKSGAPNPTVDLQFYDISKGDVFEVDIAGSFAPDNLLITEVIWAGSSGKALIRETNRESDVLRVVLVDVATRTGQTVRTEDVQKLDGGWFEVSQKTRYVPADPENGRPEHGYIDTVIHENYDHLGYFTPLDNPTPILLTSGNWEVVDAPSAVDLKKNLVYFVATKESPIQRHVYSVFLNGTNLEPLTDTKEGHYGVSFSSGAGYALLDYDGPDIPWQKVISTHSNSDHYEHFIEENPGLADMAQKHELPHKIFSTVNIDGYELQVVERRPPHFNEKKKYPVLFYLYGGPGSQTVTKSFGVDFQAYIAANLGYIVVTVDGRGTGFIGRKARTIVRGNLGYYESRDQIETAKIWAQKKYVDASRMAIWGWSYGGFMTLKTLEQDAGQTFSYGMAVAPVTDWRFYDSIYTERYMHTPQHNPGGYDNATISNMTALHQNIRFLIMHGVADDNVHMQNTLTLLDRLDVAGVENYDVHVFPDSDHGIYFHNANRIVYDKLNNWLINAFNGEWLRTSEAVPLQIDSEKKN